MINLAVVGCGYWGPNLIRNFKSASGCTVTKVCDCSEERLANIRRLFPDCQVTAEYQEILDDPGIDGVVVATPPATHFSFASQALARGKHTFVEKPMATRTADCRELIESARRAGVILMTGHTFIYNPSVRKIKEIVKAGELGEIFYISSRRLNLGLFQNRINVAWDLAPHDISIILYTLEKYPVSVNCQGKAHIKPGIEDVTNISLNFANGAFAMIHSSWIDPRKVRETTIVGSRKMLVYDDNEPLEKIKIYDKCVEIPPRYDTFAEFTYSYHYGDMHAPYVKQVEPLKLECQSFVDSIVTGAPSDSDGEEGLKVVRILEAAAESLKNEGAVVELSGRQRAIAV
jgi:predicted dehydrogenase